MGQATLDAPRALALPVMPQGGVPEWAMIARVGSWAGHPLGPERITPEHLRSALEHFRRHYREHGADLPVDYHHASVLAAYGRVERAPAAGWIREVDLRAGDTELWAQVMWTGEAAGAIAARQFRYLSPVLRFGTPDRVTGEGVPMLVHSVALTNTPFLTELPALNEQALCGAPADTSSEGGAAMPIVEQMAAALGRPAEELLQELGLESAEDGRVAQALVANAARARELETQLARVGVLVGALGVPEGADAETMLNAVEALKNEGRRTEAEQLVDAAVERGRIPPAQRAYFLNCALGDLEGTRQCLESLSAVLSPHGAGMPVGEAAHRRELTDAERSVCRQLGLSEEAFLAAER